MEIIDKEQKAEESAQEYASRFYDFINSDRKWDASKVNYKNGYLSGFNEAESFYTKQIEEKEKHLQLVRQSDLLSRQKLNKIELQLSEAKELLKSVINHIQRLSGTEYFVNKIEAFLNKQD